VRIFTLSFLLASLPAQQGPAPGANGLPRDPSFFPLAVWLQAPSNAARFRELGINLYVGLYGGPTQQQLEALEKAGMPVVCEQNDVGLTYRGKVIVGWMHGDEPDNAQAAAVGYGPPIAPWQVVESYERMKKADPTRPVWLNLGQGVAWDAWHGRGSRTNHPEDYPEYCKGGDVVSFDIYPVTHDKPAVAGKLEYVGRGVQRLCSWTNGKKPVFACIETTHVNNKDALPTPEQVRAEVWMAIACGARGVIYFAHEFAPQFVEAGLLAHADVAAAVKAVNAEVLAMAKVLNGASVEGAVRVDAGKDAEVAVLCKADGKDLVLFTASLTGAPVHAKFTVAGAKAGSRVEVLGEKRECRIDGGAFTDDFAAYAIHHYRVAR
jgi:hypothetical protein